MKFISMRATTQSDRAADVPWGPPWVPAWRGAGWRGRWRWWQVSGWRALSAAWTGLLAASAAAPDAPAPASAHAWAAAVAGFVRSCWRSLREAWKRQDARNCCGKSRERQLSFHQRLHRSGFAERFWGREQNPQGSVAPHNGELGADPPQGLSSVLGCLNFAGTECFQMPIPSCKKWFTTYTATIHEKNKCLYR